MTSHTWKARAARLGLALLLALGLVGRFLAPTPHPGGLLAQWIHGAGPTLATALIVTTVGVAVGIVGSAIATLGPPMFDPLLSRSAELAGAMPSLILVLVLRAVHPASDLVLAGAVVATLRGLESAQALRAQALQLSAEDFVLAARALGSGPLRLFRQHLWPYLAAPAVAHAAFSTASLITLDAGLSVVGFASGGSGWGAQLGAAARSGAPLDAVLPALGVILTVGCLLGVAGTVDARWSVGRRFL